MSEKTNGSGREYTVDEILAEFDGKHSPDSAQGRGNKAADTTDYTDNINTSDSSGENAVQEPVPEVKTAPIIENVIPAEPFDSENTKAVSAEELFSSKTAEGEPDSISNVHREKIADVHREKIAESVNEALAEWNDIPSIAEETRAQIIPQELEEDIVTEEERKSALESGIPDSDPEVISVEDEDADDESADDGSDGESSDEDTDGKNADKGSDGENADESSDDSSEKSEVNHTNDGSKPEKSAEEPISAKDLGEASEEKPKNGFISGIIPCKGDSVFEIIRKIIFIVAVAVFIGAGIMLISTLVQSRRAVNDLNEIKDIVTTTAATSIDSDGSVVTVAPTEEEEIEHNIDIMTYYKEISEDVVGFIELEGCDIYQPVVQGDDNEYYLKHTYYGESNKGGAIFADYRCRIEEDYMSPNIVLYGHNQEDGTMFGNLKNYKQDLDFYAENPTVTFRTEYGAETYLIYGFFVTNALEKQDSNGEVFHYHDYIEVMNDEYTFNWYLGEVRERNQIVSPVDVEFGDQLLCLSTCSNEFSNSRFVVFARKLREGESVSDYDFTEAYFNSNAKGVDWEAILSGETTTTTETTEEIEESTEETTEEITEESTEETTLVPETETTTTPAETEETSKTKRVDRTKTTYVHTINTPAEETSEEDASVTEVPEADGSDETTTETAGISETTN